MKKFYIYIIICSLFLGEILFYLLSSENKTITVKTEKPEAGKSGQEAVFAVNKTEISEKTATPASLPHTDKDRAIQTEKNENQDISVDSEKKETSEESEYELNQKFESEALEFFPLHTVETFNPDSPRGKGPAEGEIWIRIKAANAPEMKSIMADIAALYKETTKYDKKITVMNWVGGRPWARFQYPSED